MVYARLGDIHMEGKNLRCAFITEQLNGITNQLDIVNTRAGGNQEVCDARVRVCLQGRSRLC